MQCEKNGIYVSFIMNIRDRIPSQIIDVHVQRCDENLLEAGSILILYC